MSVSDPVGGGRWEPVRRASAPAQWPPAPAQWPPTASRPWVPVPAPDDFWGPRAAFRVERTPERTFWGKRARVHARPPFAVWSAQREHRFAGLLLLAGFFAVFVDQATFLYQLVLGAPIFEEMFKFGLALLLATRIGVATAPGRLLGELSRWPLAAGVGAGLGAMAAWDPLISGELDRVWPDVTVQMGAAVGAGLFLVLTLLARVGVAAGVPLGALGIIRVPLAFAVGAGFGILEHTISYNEEPVRFLYGRVAFHGGATALTMILYSIVASLPDVRVRWLALVPSVVLHWLNNASAIFVSLISLTVPRLDEFWSLSIVTMIYVLMVASLPLALPLRRGARYFVGRRHRGDPSA